jgi:hypothetical protein
MTTSSSPNTRDVEAGIHRDLREEITYGGYLNSISSSAPSSR